MSNFTQQDLASGPNSVTRTRKKWVWNKLSDTEPLSRLHAKFWRKSMVEEEEEWRQMQGQSVGGAEDGFDARMVDNSGEGAQEDDEIGPGCYFLDIGIEGLQTSKIWVRSDYIRVYDFCNERYECVRGYRASAVIITGQPGVGKSFWVYYALRRRLSEGEPILWYRDQRFYLFVGQGVFEVHERFPLSYFKPRVWAFIDSKETRDVSWNVFPDETPLFVLYMVSPSRHGSPRLSSRTCVVRAVMNPWTEKEILQAASVHRHIDRACVKELFERLGPTPRICIELALDPGRRKKYEDRLARDLKALTLDKLREMTYRAEDDSVVHRMALITRGGDYCERSRVTPITSSVKSRLAGQLRHEERSKQLELYDYMGYTNHESMANVVYESVVQQMLQDNIDLELVPMVKLDGLRGSQWHSSHQLLDNPDLEVLRQEAWQQKLNIHFTPSVTVTYQWNKLSDVAQGVFYVPESTRQAGFDPFILADDGSLYIFRFSITSDHAVNHSMVDFLTQSLCLPMESWRIVFIIPPKSTITCPLSCDSGLKRLKLFSAVVDLSP